MFEEDYNEKKKYIKFEIILDDEKKKYDELPDPTSSKYTELEK